MVTTRPRLMPGGRVTPDWGFFPNMLTIICFVASLKSRKGSNRNENEGVMPNTLGEDLTANLFGWATAGCFFHVMNHSFPFVCNVQRALQPEY